jgi:tripartite-type tricarboxylate transporter receptor subunit TctC
MKPVKMSRRVVSGENMRKLGADSFLSAASAALALLPAISAAQSYPVRPVRVIVMSTPGSGPDILARLLNPKITEAFGQSLVIDNRAGASGIIGAEIGAKAAPDGHTLTMATSQVVIVSVMYEKLPFDLHNDFAPVSLLGSTPFIMVVNPSVPARDIKEFIALLKSKPGELRYGSGGAGSPPHLAAETFKSMTGTAIQHVPYKGVSPALTDTISGQLQMTISVVPMIMPHIKAGKVRALGVTSPSRTLLAPDLPSLAELLPGYEAIGWYGLLSPARTPANIINKLNTVLVKAMKSPEIIDKMTALGVEAKGTSSREFAAHLSAETDKMRKAVKASGAKVE